MLPPRSAWLPAALTILLAAPLLSTAAAAHATTAPASLVAAHAPTAYAAHAPTAYAARAAAAKPPVFHGRATLSAGKVTVTWTASSRRVSRVELRVSATVGGKRLTPSTSARHAKKTATITIKGGAALTPAAVTFRGRNCVKSGSKTTCGAWSKPKHPTAAAAKKPISVDTSPISAPPLVAGSGPSLGGCRMLPTSSAFNQDISQLPVDANSANYVGSIGLGAHVHPDFGAADLGQGPGGFGIPYVVVPQAEPLVPIAFTDYGDESEPGPYPIPIAAPVEGGPNAEGDRHVLAVRQGDCTLFEMGNAYPQPGGTWKASGGAAWNLATGVRTSGAHPGWTSADAAGLPILPGLARTDEVAAGAIDHALRVTVSKTQRAYVAPASHDASSDTDPDLPPMGLRLRMRADYDLSGFKGQSLVIATALKRYGLIVADNGSPWYISGAPSTNWNDDDLNQLKAIPGSAFEAVQTGPVVRS